MIEKMEIFSYVLMALIGALIIAGAVLSGKIQTILSYSALFLQIPLTLALLLKKAEIEEVAVIFTLTLLLHVVANSIAKLIVGRHGGRDKEAEEQ